MSREAYAFCEGYVLYPIADDDKDNFVELQRQINGDSTIFLMSAIKDFAWNTLLSYENDRAYSIYESGGEYCGCIELNNYKDDIPEIALNLVEGKRNQGVAAKAVKMLVKKLCEERRVDYFLVRIMSDNSHSKHVFEKMGAVLIGEEDRPEVKLLKELNKLKLEYGEKIAGDTGKHDVDCIDENVFVYKYKLPTGAFIN